MQGPIYKQKWFIPAAVAAVVVFGVMLAVFGDYPEEVSATVSTGTSSTDQVSINAEEPSEDAGIDAAKFEHFVQASIDGINEDGVIGKIEVTDVLSNTAFVKLYLSDVSYWSQANETEQKEFVNSMGILMDNCAVSAAIGDITVGAETTICSPSGLELGQRTIFGNVKIF